MSERVVAIANGEPNVGFNLSSLKYKLILHEQECDKCKKSTKDWMIVGLCHHTVCLECANVRKINKCLVCSVRFNPKKHSSTVAKMKTAFSQIEELVFYVTALDKGTMHTIEPNTAFKQKFQNKSTISVNGIPNVMQDAAETDVIEQQTNLRSTNVSTMFIQNNDILMQDAVETDVSIQQTYPSRSASESPMDVFDQSQNIEFAEDNNLQTDVGMDSSSNNERVNKNKNELSDNTDLSSNCSSDINDVIIGTPERNKRLPMVLCHSGMQREEEIDIIKQMAYMFKIEADTNWSYSTTHLIVTHNSKKGSIPTVKFVKSMVNNCYIVKYQWVLDCINSKSLLPELDYMALNVYGDETPIISLKVGQGLIESPMQWCKNCGIFIHNLIKDSILEYLMDVAKRSGFVVLEKLEDFKHCNLKIRAILFINSAEITEDMQQPDHQLITRWMYDYKAVTVGYDWLIDCIIRYSFVPFSPLHQLMRVEHSLVKSAELDESLFEFNII